LWLSTKKQVGGRDDLCWGFTRGRQPQVELPRTTRCRYCVEEGRRHLQRPMKEKTTRTSNKGWGTRGRQMGKKKKEKRTGEKKRPRKMHNRNRGTNYKAKERIGERKKITSKRTPTKNNGEIRRERRHVIKGEKQAETGK